MEKFELNFTEDDINKIKSKRNQSNIAFFIAFFILALIVYFMESSTPIFLKIIAYFFFAITGYTVFNMIFGDNSSKDLKNKIKIVTKVIVINKNIKTRGRDATNYYELEFDGNNDIKHYQVKQSVFDKIKIGDIIDIEYSKESFWLLKIKLNSLDIENKDYVK